MCKDCGWTLEEDEDGFWCFYCGICVVCGGHYWDCDHDKTEGLPGEALCCSGRIT